MGALCVVEPSVGQALAADTFPSSAAPPFLLMAWTQASVKHKQGLVEGSLLRLGCKNLVMKFG